MALPIPELLVRSAEPFNDPDNARIEALLQRIGSARVVLLGEATHGSSEVYRLRARITRELVEHHGFDFVAVEADWPDAQRIDTYVRHLDIPTPDWRAFARFPTWMWRNAEVHNFVQWLRTYNASRSDIHQRIGFHGLDLYSMFSSMGAVLEYLDGVDPEIAALARERYGCLSPWGQEPADYGAATEMSTHGETNVGELCRREFGDDAALVGFGTDHGTVAAADVWDGPMRVKQVRPAIGGSYERLCHETELSAFTLPLRNRNGFNSDPALLGALRSVLMTPRLERAIGVIYRPQTERQSHYFQASLPQQFDEYIWIDETNAVTPLPTTPVSGMPDTYPFGV